MKEQIKRNSINRIGLFNVLIFTILLMSSFELMAQRGKDPGWPEHNNAQENLTTDGLLHTINYSADYQDMLVASTTGYKYLHLSVRGGDGGARINKALIKPYKTKGGGGATAEAYFELGSRSDQIAQGDLLRFIVGHGGDINSSADMVGADGGAGSGVFLKKNGSSEWITLMVAGGGGGAYSDCCTVNSAGRSASTGTGGQDGGGIGGGDGGRNGGNGDDYIHAYGGGGVNGVFKNGEPIGSTDHYSGSYYDYLYGCGHGGDAIGNGISGGGGGGYSGGGGGATSASGGGGGSYINPDRGAFVRKISVSSQTNDPKDGHANYRFVPESSLVFSKIEAVGRQGYGIGTQSSSTASSQDLRMVNLSSTTQHVEWVLVENTIALKDDSKKCLDLENRNTTPGTNIHLSTCNGDRAQEWLYDGLTQQIRYRASLSKCVSRKSNNIQLEDCKNTDEQKWYVPGATTTDLSENQVATIRPIKAQNQCIDNIGGKIADGNPIQLSHCAGTDGNDNQKWFFDGLGLRLSEARDKCLDVPSTNNGTPIQLYYCHATDHGAESHEWVYDGITKTIRYRDNLNKCLSTDGDNTADGASILIQDCNSALDEIKWVFEQTEPNPDDLYFGEFTHARDTERCIDLKSGNASNTANIQSWPCNGTWAQKWMIMGKQIKLAKDLDFCLALSSKEAKENDNAHLMRCDGQLYQQWIFDVPYQFIRSNRNPNHCLYVNSHSDIKLEACDYSDPERMQWNITDNYSERLSGENLRIHLAKDEGKCIDMKENKEDGNLRVWDCEENNSQYFVFEGPRIRRNNSNLCVDIHTTNPGENIRLWPCNNNNINTAGQAWFYDAVSGRIHSNADPTKCMRFDSGQAKNFANIKLGTCDDSIAEIFVIK